MKLPDGFRFSQGNLQDFDDCRRRFQLRYIQRQAWPAVDSEPFVENERFMQQGQQFHQLAQQYFIGIPPEQLARIIYDPELEGWWNNFVSFFSGLTKSLEWEKLKVYPEMILSSPVGGYNLVAKYDLILFHTEGEITIYDWKTSRTQPDRNRLASRLQTKVYPYLLTLSGTSHGQNVDANPNLIKMIYWFTNFPNEPQVFEYNEASFKEGHDYLTTLIDLIDRLEEDEFVLTTDEKKCRFCVYRSLCDRGSVAGVLRDQVEFLDVDTLDNFVIDFDKIEDIEY